MNKEELLALARQAGFTVDGDNWIHSPNAVLVDGKKSIDKLLANFAVLVAKREREAIAKTTGEQT